MKYVVLALSLAGFPGPGALAQTSNSIGSKRLPVDQSGQLSQWTMGMGEAHRVVDPETGVICYVAQPARPGGGPAMHCFKAADLK